MGFMVQALKISQIDAILDENTKIKIKQSLNSTFSYFILNQPEYSNRNEYTIALQKDSKLTSEFNNILLELKISGQLDHLKKKWGPISK